MIKNLIKDLIITFDPFIPVLFNSIISILVFNMSVLALSIASKEYGIDVTAAGEVLNLAGKAVIGCLFWMLIKATVTATESLKKEKC